MSELATRYSFKNTEEKWYRFWEEKGFFHAEIDAKKKPFVILIPPPNITGILHMGHALNNTLQDIMIRYKKMAGDEALWMPGTDHAGIATQNVVERAVSGEGLTRQALGREEFLKRVWAWKEAYGSTIIQQLKRLGCACDWQRERFTMDTDYSNAVLEVFVSLYKKGLIFRGNYIINWCPRCQTALSDEEAPHKEVDGFLYYIKYPFKDQRQKTKDKRPYVVVATTRPETMLGDTAVAVNPKDKRYNSLIGRIVILPLLEREIKIISDEFVDPEFGTGAVKVTPAHDPNDYAIGKRHNLEFINIMHPDGRCNENTGAYAGRERFEARAAIIEDLKEKNLLLKVEPHKHAVGHCYRCHTIIEPYLSKQWFVKMKPLSIPAIKAVTDGKIKFYPERWTKVYLNWMENIQDWCISRQIWWGHRLPVYYCKNCQEQAGEFKVQSSKFKERTETKGVIVSKHKPDKCPDCGLKDIFQDEDVLDTWFSSWLWPFATFGWPFNQTKDQKSKPENREPKTELAYFYPTSVLVTAQEIIFFWVARMIMAGIEFIGDIPFKDVYIHGTVRDPAGKKMSKSLGNIIDPLEIIEDYGADALRFSLISITATGQDVFLAKDKFEFGRNFANKIWNASRFILMNLDRELIKGDLCVVFEKEKLALAQAWILSRFYSTLKDLNKALSNYRFNEAANYIYEFFWHQFCDWYIELAKLTIMDKNTQFVLYKVLEKSLRILHPFMPYLTEEIWQKVNPNSGSIMSQSWPHLQKNIIDKKLEKKMERLIECTTVIRNLRSERNIKPKENVDISIFEENIEIKKFLNDHAEYLKSLSKINKLEFMSRNICPSAAVSSAVATSTVIYLDSESAVDIGKERRRIEKQIVQLQERIAKKDVLLNNEQFINKAASAAVKKEKQLREELKDKLSKLSEILKIKDALK